MPLVVRSTLTLVILSHTLESHDNNVLLNYNINITYFGLKTSSMLKPQSIRPIS